MRLYLFEAGVLKSKKHFFTLNQGLGEPFDVPVPFFLIDHPRGKVLFDTGNALETVDRKREHWGAMVDAYDVVMAEDQWCANAIRKVGVEPGDIDYVILSHLHLDHAGGVGHFPNARYVVQRDELAFAYVPDPYMKGAYIRKDFDKDVDWMLLEGWRDDGFDFFGDGSVTICFTPGHTPGHQSILVDLPDSGPMFLAGDACYTRDNLENGSLPGVMWSAGETVRSVARMRRLASTRGAAIVFGHDPEGWATLRKAPEYYD
ncbi:MAG: N-acyl homoserine lactonase family protein [Desulfovibrionaceae bacterium]|jgi:glyoxylase-like metal-dependent hydrolase (beta-lactamase superfamily II)|nr:N-acyl homoserine lactonase family protein [Desulfovibrionaceae bacterium]